MLLPPRVAVLAIDVEEPLEGLRSRLSRRDQETVQAIAARAETAGVGILMLENLLSAERVDDQVCLVRVSA